VSRRVLAYNPPVPATSPADRLASGDAAADRCPGVLRLAVAADGHLARIRLPGGLIGAEHMRVLARLAGELGDGRVELTSRGNVQLRGLAADVVDSLTDQLIRAGLLPSLSHDRVRNVLASPLAGLDGGRDLTAIVRALDSALCARPRLAELPGRFLFAADDGRGDVASLGADVVALIQPDGAVVNGLAVTRGGATDDADAIVTVMLACAEAFLDEAAAQGGTAWRIADLADGAERVRAAVVARLGLAAAARPPDAAPASAGPASAGPASAGPASAGPASAGPASAGPASAGPAFAGPAARPVGVVGPGGTAAVLLAPLGRLTAAQLTWLAGHVTGRPARITPWRSVVLPDLPDAAGVLRDADRLGFGVDMTSPWLRVSACAGRPRCASALADVQADAAAFAARWPEQIVHVSGCARHCGRPAATQIDVTATSEGYQVAGI
jgi:precorrin-3B synthase